MDKPNSFDGIQTVTVMMNGAAAIKFILTMIEHEIGYLAILKKEEGMSKSTLTAHGQPNVGITYLATTPVEDDQ